MTHECSKQEVINDMKKDIDNLFSMKEVVVELKTLVKMQIEQNQKQDKLIQQQSEALIRTTETVTQQGELIKSLKNGYEHIHEEFQQHSLNDVRDNSISFGDIIRRIISDYLPPVILMGILYLILQAK